MTVTANGHPLESCIIDVPLGGRWSATIGVPTESLSVGDAVVIDFEGAKYSGTILYGRSVSTLESEFVVSPGRGRLGESVPARGYQSDSGVFVESIVGELAVDVGEVITGLAIDTVGNHYARQAGPAYAALDSLFGPTGWHTDNEGSVTIGERDADAINVAADIFTHYRPDVCAVVVPSNFAAYAPGRSVVIQDQKHTITLCRFVLCDSKTWIDLGLERSDALALLAKFVEAKTAKLKFLGVHEYRFVSGPGDAMNLEIVDGSTGMPSLESVPPMPGVSGSSCEPVIGSKVLVSFVNGDRTRPVVTSYQRDTISGGTPHQTSLDGTVVTLGGNSARVIRENISVVIQGGVNVVSGTVTGILTINPLIPPVPPIKAFA